jgi:dTDP-glucose 4,6-dehydratase
MNSDIKTMLVTGGAGFIGSNFLNKYVSKYPDITFVNLDKLTYAANLDNLTIKESPNYKFIELDICNLTGLTRVFETYRFDGVIHFAAESHVDLSIKHPSLFVESNVLGTQNLLQLSLEYGVTRFHHVSTDEVYGSLGETGFFTEETNLAPNSPYSASKAGADCLVRSYFHTFGLNTVITRCSNNYGPYQDITKLIPKFITNLLQDKKVPLYASGGNIRDWLYVEDHVDAIWEVFTRSKPGEIYNIGGNSEKTNLEITNQLLQTLGKDESYIEYVADRPGHDFRYAIDASKIKRELGWQPKYTFESGIHKTIEFYKSKYS